MGRGECWDLAAQALNQSGALWDGAYAFGKRLDLNRDCVFPGDIIQFENVQVQYTKQNAVYRETMDHHTAVVFSVDENKNMILAEQNTSDGGKRVRLSEFIPGNVRTGNVYVYRPVSPWSQRYVWMSFSRTWIALLLITVPGPNTKLTPAL